MHTRFSSVPVRVRTSASVALLVTCAGIAAAQNVKLNPELARSPGTSGEGTGALRVGPGTWGVLGVVSGATLEQKLYRIELDGSLPPVRLDAPATATLLWNDAFSISPDGARVVHTGFDGANRHLYSVPNGSGTVTPLSAPAAPGIVFATSYVISPDSTRVAFVGSDLAVWSCPIDGSAPALQLGPPAGTSVLPLAISPDSTRVVYRADPDIDGQFELFSVPIDGSAAPVELNVPLASNQDVAAFEIEAQGARVVYSAISRLWSVPIDGSAASVEVSAVPSGHLTVLDFRVAPDGVRVAFRAIPNASSTTFLISAPVDASATPVLLSPVPAGTGPLSDYAFTPDSALVLYRGTQASPTAVELFRVPADGSASSSKLNGALVSGGNVTQHFRTPDGQRVLYLADQLTNDVFELFSVPIGGGTPVRVNGPMTTGGDVTAVGISPDSTRLVYTADQLADQVFEVFAAPSDGSSSPVKLNDPLPQFGDAGFVAFSADGTRAVFAADAPGLVDHVFSAPSDGSAAATDLTPPLDSGPVTGDVRAFHVQRGGLRAVYVADQEVDELLELYAVTLTASPSVTKLSAPGDGSVQTDMGLTSDGARAVYRTVSPSSAVDLWSVPVDGSAPRTHLGGWSSGQGHVSNFLLAPGGARAVFKSTGGLFSVPTDGSAVPVRIDAAGTSANFFQIAPDASRVAFTSGVRLFVRPIDASLPVVDVTGTLVAGGGVQLLADGSICRFGAAGTRVVFRADALADERFEVFSAPVAGGPRVRLNLELPVNGFVRDVVLDPLGARVLYRADQETLNQVGLYVVPIDGSQPPVKLNAALPQTESVRVFPAFTPDGARVVFLADRLYVVPADASAAPTPLSAPGDSFAFLSRVFDVDPSGQRVVYVARSTGSTQTEVFSTPLPLGGPIVRLNAPFAAGGEVPFEGLHPRMWVGERRVRFVADAATDETFELYDAPIDGSRPPERRNETLVPGGDVTTVGLAGRTVVYLADQEADDIFELFVDLALPPGAAAPAPSRTVTRQL